MDYNLKNITLFVGVALTGLSAGLFYAWSVSVIPGTKKVLDPTYLETMQHINREILNPSFFLIFFGSMMVLALGTIIHYETGTRFSLMLGASVAYTVGTFAVTGLGNVQLNNELEALNLMEMTEAKIKVFRQYYEARWNSYHMIRTVFSVLAFLLSLLAAFHSHKNI